MKGRATAGGLAASLVGMASVVAGCGAPETPATRTPTTLCSEPTVGETSGEQPGGQSRVIATPSDRACCHRTAARLGRRANEREPLPAPSLDADAVTVREWTIATLERHQSALDACYSCALVVEPATSGHERVRFVIDETGRVSATAVVEAAVSDPALSRCATHALARARYSPRPGAPAMVVTVALQFDPRHGVRFALE